jgi:hypothetical protein
MNPDEILRNRLLNQRLIQSAIKKPEEVVSWLGAMQAQEYTMAKWAIGLRMGKSSDAVIEKAFTEGLILRTHLLRPTWHFVTPADIRWMLKLTAPRIHALNAYMYRQTELDQNVLKKSNTLIEKALRGKALTRAKLQAAIEKSGITAKGLRLGYILMNAELEGLICSGPREGKQFTYSLLDERVPILNETFSKDESLQKLADRYFKSRGPATIQDFVTWSGITMTDAKRGIATLHKGFEKVKLVDQEYIFFPMPTIPKALLPTFLMPDYDEYGMGYKDRSALRFSEPAKKSGKDKSTTIAYNRMMIVDGRIAGSWKRTFEKNKVVVETVPIVTINKRQQLDVKKAIDRFTKFIGKNFED